MEWPGKLKKLRLRLGTKNEWRIIEWCHQLETKKKIYIYIYRMYQPRNKPVTEIKHLAIYRILGFEWRMPKIKTGARRNQKKNQWHVFVEKNISLVWCEFALHNALKVFRDANAAKHENFPMTCLYDCSFIGRSGNPGRFQMPMWPRNCL